MFDRVNLACTVVQFGLKQTGLLGRFCFPGFLFPAQHQEWKSFAKQWRSGILTFEFPCFIHFQRRSQANGEPWPHDKIKEERSPVLWTTSEPWNIRISWFKEFNLYGTKWSSECIFKSFCLFCFILFILSILTTWTLRYKHSWLS